MEKLLKQFGRLYSDELDIDLQSKKSNEIFKWLLASMLYGARISETIAKNTYFALKKYKLLTPRAIIKSNQKFLVTKVMAEGGYVRYDGKTSAKLLSVSKKLIDEYNADLNQLHDLATDYNDLAKRLMEFKGIGPITVNIFLRELREIWKKANPPFSDFVKIAAKNLGIEDIEDYWQKNKIRGYKLVNFEVALLRLGKNFYRKNRKKINTLNL